MRTRSPALRPWVWISWLTLVAPATGAGCRLDEPSAALGRLFPRMEWSSARYLTFGAQAPGALERIRARLGVPIDAAPESPYPVYTAYGKTGVIGHVYGTRRRGAHGELEIFAVLAPDLSLARVHVQRFGSPVASLFTAAPFLRELAAVPLADFAGFRGCYTGGLCDDLPVGDPTYGDQADDFRALIVAMALLDGVRTEMLGVLGGKAPPAGAALEEWIEEVDGLQWPPAPVPAPAFAGVTDASTALRDWERVWVQPGSDGVHVYPIRCLEERGIVNDRIGEGSLALIWSPEAQWVTVLDRWGADGPEDLEVDASLLFGTAVLSDRRTRSTWSAVLGEALGGAARGSRLARVGGGTMDRWSAVAARHPDCRVLLPVVRDRPPEARDRDGATRVVAVALAGVGDVAAWTGAELDRRGGLIHATVGASGVVVVRVGETAVAYATRLGTRTLRFARSGPHRLRDTQTGSTWDPDTGFAVAGPLTGARLEPKALLDLPGPTFGALFPRVTPRGG